MKKLIAMFAIGMLLRDKARRDRLINGARDLFARAKELTPKPAPTETAAAASSPTY